MIKKICWSSKLRIIKDSFYNIRDAPYSIDIENWRVISYGHLFAHRYGSIDGTFIKTQSQTWFFPSLTIENLFEFLINKETSLQQFFLYVRDRDVPLCHRCEGSGKLDWISYLTKVRPSKFVRDPSIILQYHEQIDRNGKTKEITYPYFYISQSKLEKGEFHCSQCVGTGMKLDGRLRLYASLKKIKTRLKQHDSESVIKQVISNKY